MKFKECMRCRGRLVLVGSRKEGEPGHYRHLRLYSCEDCDYSLVTEALRGITKYRKEDR